MKPRVAPTASAATVMASTIANGSSSSTTRSLNVPGSDSSALQTTKTGPGLAETAARAAAHLRAVGNAAPPRPTSRALASSSITRVAPMAIALARAR
jgi:hypothetical protein